MGPIGAFTGAQTEEYYEDEVLELDSLGRMYQPHAEFYHCSVKISIFYFDLQPFSSVLGRDLPNHLLSGP